jgi:hypothetical protein
LCGFLAEFFSIRQKSIGKPHNQAVFLAKLGFGLEFGWRLEPVMGNWVLGLLAEGEEGGPGAGHGEVSVFGSVEFGTEEGGAGTGHGKLEVRVVG